MYRWFACILLVVGVAVNSSVSVAAQSVCANTATATEAVRRLKSAMAGGRFVAYQPTQIRVIDGHASHADAEGIRSDLKALRTRFDGLVTYGSGNGADTVADVAAELGFRAVILGVWSIDDEGEIGLALAAALRHPGLVIGLSLGNERAFGGETSLGALAERLERLRKRAPGLGLSTTEPFHLFMQKDAVPLLEQLDFMLVNVHPVFQPWFSSASAEDSARFVVNVVNDLNSRYCGPLLVKETGVPTAPESMGYTESRQAAFYHALRAIFPPSPKNAFVYFSAFDAAWRVYDSHPSAGPQPQEGSWGLFEESRRPKPAALDLPALPAPGGPTHDGL